MLQTTITDSLNTDYKAYCRYTVMGRAIPSFVDGMKPVNRKALFCALKYANDKPIKVSSLAGYMMAKADYHHGDTSACSAITIMAQDFMQGMPYFDKDGQFGWLYDRTAGAARYIKVKTSGWSKLLFKDEAELTWNTSDDGERIEPTYYLPILPMMLINGVNGIAVGYSTSFTNLNPLEIACCVKEYLVTGNLRNYDLTPFANGHTGFWSWFREGFEHVAPWHRKNETTIVIDGLPINLTLEKFKRYLNELIEQNLIQKYTELSSKGKCTFEIKMHKEQIDRLISENGIPRMFRLIYRLPKDNMVAVMPDKSIKRFDSPIAFIKDFVDFRLRFYVKRRKRLIRDIEQRITYLESLNRFIELVVNSEIDLRGKNRRTLEAELSQLQILKEVLNEHLYNLTADNIIKHRKEIAELQKQLSYLQNTTEKAMYITDINELLTHIRKYYTQEQVLNVNNERIDRVDVNA